MPAKHVGIIGSGVVAQALGSGFLKHGYAVMLGTRDASKLKAWKKEAGPSARVGTFEQAAKFGEVVVLAVKGTAAESAARAAGLSNLSGKTVIDTCNPIEEAAPVNGVLRFFTSPNSSLLESLRKLAPKARWVKAFSCIGSAFMVNPEFYHGKPSMFICGDDERAK